MTAVAHKIDARVGLMPEIHLHSVAATAEKDNINKFSDEIRVHFHPIVGRSQMMSAVYATDLVDKAIDVAAAKKYNNHIHIVFNGKIVQHDTKLCDAGISNGDVVRSTVQLETKIRLDLCEELTSPPSIQVFANCVSRPFYSCL